MPRQRWGPGWFVIFAIAGALALVVLILILISQCDSDGDEQAVEIDEQATPTVAPTVAETPSAPSVSEGSGPIAQWMFDGDAMDATGNGHDANALGEVEYVGGAADMDGIDDAFQVPDKPDLNPSDAITIAAWWNAVDFRGAGNNGLVDKGFTSHEAPFYQYHLGVTGTEYGTGESRFDFWVAVSPTPDDDPSDDRTVATGYKGWTAGQVYHLVGTYDGSEVRLYVNGALEASTAASGSIADYGQDLFIARFTNIDQDGVAYLPGAIDEVAIWDRALSADEIAELYSAGTP